MSTANLLALDVGTIQARHANALRCTVEDVMPEGWAVLYAQDVAALLQALDRLCVTHQQCSGRMVADLTAEAKIGRGYRAALEHIDAVTANATDPGLVRLRRIARTALGKAE